MLIRGSSKFRQMVWVCVGGGGGDEESRSKVLAFFIIALML